MPKASILQEDFSTGEVSPLFYARTSQERYRKSLAACQNYIPTVQGPLIRRPGTYFVNNTINGVSNPSYLVPFQVSSTVSYMLEITSGQMTFYINNGEVTATNYYTILSTSGDGTTQYSTRFSLSPYKGETIRSSSLNSGTSILYLVTPWVQNDDLTKLRWSQTQDSLYFTHPNYPPYRLKLVDTDEWVLEQLPFVDGPYLPLNSYVTIGDSLGITLTPGATSGSVTITSGPEATVSGAASNGSEVRITTAAPHGFLNGQRVYISGVTGTTEANNTTIGGVRPWWVIIVIDASTFDLIGSVFANNYISGGIAFPALFTKNPDLTFAELTDTDLGRPVGLIGSDGHRYYGVVSGTNTDVANITVTIGQGQSLPDTSGLTGWYMGVYWGPGVSITTNIFGNFPTCLTFHQDRLFLSGALHSAQQLDASQPGIYTAFTPSDTGTLAVNDNNSLQFGLQSKLPQIVQWMSSSAQGLLVGTFTSEWTIAPNSQGQALTPTNFNAAETSYYGSAGVDAVRSGNATLYIQKGQRKLREMNYFFQVGTFRSSDLTELSEHLTIPTIIKIDIQKETQPIIWAVRSDGVLLSMLYNRDDQILKAGWARHILGGQSDSAGSPPIVLNIGVMPDPTNTFDQLWMIVKRWVNGQTVIGIEYLTPFYNDAILQEDAITLDYASTFDNPKTITGISTASPAVVTANGHGFSNGNTVKITGVTGLNMKTTDINGNVSISNLVNEMTFVVASSTTNTFALHDFSGNAVSSTAFSSWVAGGQVRKLITTISGLTYLENETVSILADGGIHPNVTVSNSGAITLAYPAAKVQIGYFYNSDGQLLRPEAGAADGTSIGKTRRVARVALMIHKIGDLMMGMDFKKLIPAQFLRGDELQGDLPPPLFSGLIRDGVESAYDFEGQFCFRQSSPLPGMIQGITIFMEEFDV